MDVCPKASGLRWRNLCETAFLLEALNRVGTRNTQREFYLPDVVEMAAQQGGAAVIQARPEEMLGVNNRADLATAEAVLWERDRKSVV